MPEPIQTPPAGTSPPAPATATVTSPPVAWTLGDLFDVAQPAEPAKPATPAAPAQPAAPAGVATVATPTPAKPEHPAWLLTSARAMGVPQTDIDTLTSDVLHTRMMAAATAPRPATPAAPVATVASPPPPPSIETLFQGATVEEEVNGARVRRAVTAADLDPALVAILQNQQATIARLEKQHTDTLAAARVADERQREAQWDAAFAAFPKVFGDRPGAQLAGTAELDRRRAVYQAVMAIPEATRAGTPLQQLVEQVGRRLFAPPGAAPAPAAGTAVDRWNAGAVGQPGSTAPSGVSEMPYGEERALAGIREHLERQKAASGGNELGSVQDFLGFPLFPDR